MRPLLFELSLPARGLPYLAIWGALGSIGVLLFWLGRKAEDRGTAWLGAAVAGASGLLAVFTGFRRYESAAYPVHAFGLFLGVGLVGAYVATLREGVRSGLSAARLSAVLVPGIATGVLGARLVYVLCNGEAMALRDAARVTEGGLSLYGGFVCGAAIVWVAARRQRLRPLSALDAAFAPACVGMLLGWLGSYLAGSDYGRPLDPSAPAWLRALGTFPEASVGASPGRAVHPTQLYHAVASGFLFGGARWLRRRQVRPGMVFLCGAVALAVAQLAVEPLRADADRGILGPLSVPQWFAIATAGAAIALLAKLRKGERPLQSK